MNNKALIAIVVVLVILMGLQIYMMYQLNNRLTLPNGPSAKASVPDTILPKFPKLPPPMPSLDDDFFNDHWSPYEEMQHMQREMEHIFGNAFSRFHLNTPSGGLSKTPDVDLQEKPDRYIVTVNAPGADETSLNVKLEDQRLTISIKTAQVKDEADEKNGQYKYRERFMGEFNRVLTLPGPADASKMTTDFHNGVLTVTIPKSSKTAPNTKQQEDFL